MPDYPSAPPFIAQAIDDWQKNGIGWRMSLADYIWQAFGDHGGVRILDSHSFDAPFIRIDLPLSAATRD
jgi:hypothetical protein